MWLRSLVARLASCGALVALGCASPNAILEVELTLPPVFDDGTSTPQRFASVVARRGTGEFDLLWSTSATTEGFRLDDETTTVQTASVVSEEAFDEPLSLKVVFCATTPCRDGEGVSHWFEVERAFYPGEVTKVRLDVSADPTSGSTAPATVARCRVEGCGTGDPTSPSGFCFGGRHFCE
ncbi:MAG: hypothetical protein R3B99_34245 [Polyangiales bacterium]